MLGITSIFITNDFHITLKNIHFLYFHFPSFSLDRDKMRCSQVVFIAILALNNPANAVPVLTLDHMSTDLTEYGDYKGKRAGDWIDKVSSNKAACW